MKVMFLDMLIVLTVFMLCSCATAPITERRREVIACVIRLKDHEFKETNAFSVCSRTYGVPIHVEEKEIPLDEPKPVETVKTIPFVVTTEVK